MLWYQTLKGPLPDKKIGVELKTCKTCGKSLYLTEFRTNSNGYMYNSCHTCNKEKMNAQQRAKRANA